MKITNKKKKILIFTLYVLLLTAIIYQTHLFNDDLYFNYFNLKKIKEILNFALHYGNGRILGNMIVHIVIKNQIFRVIFHVVMLSILLILILKIFQYNYFYLILFLFIIMNCRLYAEVVFWSSAFINYVLGIIIFLICWLLYNKSRKTSSDLNSYVYSILLLIFGFFGQLFVEHTSLINLAFVVIVFLYSINDKKINLPIISWMIGCLLGIITMFLIPKIFYVPNVVEEYQKLYIFNIYEMIKHIIINYSYLSIYLFVFNVSSLLFLCLVLKKIFQKDKVIYIMFILCLISVPIYYLFKHEIISGRLFFIFGLLFFVFNLLLIIILWKHRYFKSKLIILYYFFYIFSFLPLLVVDPVGPRCLLHSYIFFILFFVELIKFENDNFLYEIETRRYRKILVSLTIILLCFISYITINTNKIYKNNNIYIRYEMKKNKKKIDISDYPKILKTYYHSENSWELTYKYYYNNPGDIKFEIIPYEEWQAKYGDKNTP